MVNEGGKLIYKELSYTIVGIAFAVYNELWYGFKEKHYENAVAVQFSVNGITHHRQVPYNVRMNGRVIGRYYLDFLVEDKVMVELKKGRYFAPQNINQVKQYLAATGLQLAILVNFTPDGVRFFRVLNPNNQL